LNSNKQSAVAETVDRLPFGTLLDLLRERAQKLPEKRGYRFLADGEGKELSLTYGELDRRARAIATSLRKIAAPGERAILLYPPGLDFVAAFYGALYAGVIAIPMYPPEPNRIAATLPRLRSIALDAGASLILTIKPVLGMARLFAEPAPEIAALLWIATDAPEVDNADNAASYDPAGLDITPSSLALLQYTSGSTAAPKGVMVSHENLLHNAAQLSRCFGVTSESRSVIWLPVHHNFGLVGGIVQPLYAAQDVIFMSPLHVVERPLRWLQAISRYQATASGAPNFAFDLCVAGTTPEERAALDLRSWTIAPLGGEPVRPDTLARFAAAFERSGFRPEAFRPSLGLAEATLTVSAGAAKAPPVVLSVDDKALQQNRLLVRPEGSSGARPLVGCGRAVSGVEILIVHPETLMPCPPDQLGEIWVSGPNVAQGYFRHPEETARTFRGFRLDTGQGPYLRTGDLGFLRDGELFVTGRVKDLIIIRGHNHYPQDIELTVERSHPALRPQASAAFTVEVEGEERLVVVAEVDARGEPIDVEVVSSEVRRAVAHKHEVQVYAVVLLEAGSIPKTASAKIQRHATRAAFLDKTLRVVGSQILAPADTNAPQLTLSREELLGAAPEERTPLLARFLHQHAARVLKMPAKDVDPSKPLDSLGLDSLMVVELKNLIAANLSAAVPYENFLEGASVNDLTKYVLDQLTGAAPAPAAAKTSVLASLAPEVVLDPSIRAEGTPGSSQGSPENILLTGATGYLGAFVLGELLARTRATVHCLVRAPDEATAKKRLAENLTGYQIPWDESLWARVVPVLGDFKQPRAGLSDGAFARLAEEIDAIYHSGAWVNFVYPYSILKPANVGGTVDMLRLAVTGRTKPMHFMSTIAVVLSGDRPREKILNEQDELDSNGELPNGYEQSKWVADKIVGLARARGVPASIYRVGLVTGNSRDGADFRMDEFLPSMIKGCIQLGLAPVLDTKLVVVPVDYVSQAIVHIAGRRDCLGKNFHLYHPQPMNLMDVIEWARQYGYPLQTLAFNEWRRRLFDLPSNELEKNALYPYLDFVLALREEQMLMPKLRLSDTSSALEGLPCPPLTELLDTYFGHFIRSGFLRAPLSHG
jgi:thioester reductase-like protein